jgi:hypothetical protein
LVHEGGVELGVIELRVGKPPKLIDTTNAEGVAKLEAELKAIGGPKGIGLDMHLPPPDGKGMGPYSTVIAKWDHPMYRFALEQKLEPKYSAKVVPEVADALPPAKFKILHVSQSGKKVGRVDFSQSPPKLTLEKDASDGSSLKNDLDRVQELGDKLAFRYHYRPKDGEATYVHVRAKPGAENYAQTIVLYLMAERYFTTRYAYELSFD